jgi:hypothetical protein
MSKIDFRQPNLFLFGQEFWGIEFADSRSFFSLKGTGQYISQEKFVEVCTESSCNSKRRIQMTDGKGVLSIDESESNGEIFRMHTFEATEQTELLDFVSRYVFPKAWFDSAVIHEKIILHKDENIYHQFPVDPEHNTIRFEGLSGGICIRVLQHEAPASFVPFLYVRDEPGFWIAHIRYLPTSDTSIVTKLNYSFYNKAIPAVWNHFLSICGLKRRLLYRGEKKHSWTWLKKQSYRLLPLTSYRLGRLEKGEKIRLVSSCALVKNISL